MFSILFTRLKSVATMKSSHLFELKYQVVILRKDRKSWREIAEKCVITEIVESTWRSIRDEYVEKLFFSFQKILKLILLEKGEPIKY